MANSKHQSRSFNYGNNPEEIADNDGYASKSPTLCSRVTSVAPSPSLAKTLLNNPESSHERVQDLIDREKEAWSASQRFTTMDIPGDEFSIPWSAYYSAPEWNPIEGMWGAVTDQLQYGAMALYDRYKQSTVNEQVPVGADRPVAAALRSTSLRRPSKYPKQYTRSQATEPQSLGVNHATSKRIFRPRSILGMTD